MKETGLKLWGCSATLAQRTQTGGPGIVLGDKAQRREGEGVASQVVSLLLSLSRSALPLSKAPVTLGN